MKFEHVLPTKVEIVDRERYILQAVAGKRVLHLGCVDSGLLNERLLDDKWLHKKIVDEGQFVVGLDDDAAGIEKIRRYYPDMKLIVANVEELEKIDIHPEAYDVIIAGEIIEHLDNVGRFLAGIRNLMTPDTTLILTTPNAFRYQNIMLSLFKKESIHPDHNYWFSWNSLNILLNKYGFYIARSMVCIIYPKIVIKKEDNIIRRVQKCGFRILDALISRIIIPVVPFWADGLILEVRKKESKSRGSGTLLS